MAGFPARFKDKVLAILEGFDRFARRGSLLGHRSAKIGRFLRLLRAHKRSGKSSPRTLRHNVILRGRELAAAVATARRLRLQQIHRAAA